MTHPGADGGSVCGTLGDSVHLSSSSPLRDISKGDLSNDYNSKDSDLSPEPPSPASPTSPTSSSSAGTPSEASSLSNTKASFDSENRGPRSEFAAPTGVYEVVVGHWITGPGARSSHRVIYPRIHNQGRISFQIQPHDEINNPLPLPRGRRPYVDPPDHFVTNQSKWPPLVHAPPTQYFRFIQALEDLPTASRARYEIVRMIDCLAHERRRAEQRRSHIAAREARAMLTMPRPRPDSSEGLQEYRERERARLMRRGLRQLERRAERRVGRRSARRELRLRRWRRGVQGPECSEGILPTLGDVGPPTADQETSPPGSHDGDTWAAELPSPELDDPARPNLQLANGIEEDDLDDSERPPKRQKRDHGEDRDGIEPADGEEGSDDEEPDDGAAEDDSEVDNPRECSPVDDYGGYDGHEYMPEEDEDCPTMEGGCESGGESDDYDDDDDTNGRGHLKGVNGDPRGHVEYVWDERLQREIQVFTPATGRP